MRVVCFYVKLAPETKAAIAAHAPQTEFVDTSADDYAYWRLLRQHWGGEDDLVVIEQDIEITAEVLPSFAACSENWCTYQYKQIYKSSVGMLSENLGCTRFSAQLMHDVPFPRASQWQFLDLAISSDIKMVTFSKTGMVFYPGMKGASGFMAAHVHGEVKHFHDERQLWHQRTG